MKKSLTLLTIAIAILVALIGCVRQPGGYDYNYPLEGLEYAEN